MITVLNGNRIDMLISVLSVATEYPVQSLKLLGSEQAYRNLVYALTGEQAFVNSDTGEVLQTKLCTISGKVPNRTIRFYKKGLEVLKWFGSYEGYMEYSFGHNLPSFDISVRRNHCIAETLAVMARCAVEYRPQALPKLLADKWGQRLPDSPVFYTSKYLKHQYQNNTKETIYTRLVGAIFFGHEYYCVYNARKEFINWDTNSETKSKVMVEEIAGMNTMAKDMSSAIIFGESMDVMKRNLEELRKEENMKKQNAPYLNKVYQNVHYVPLTEEGIRQFRIFLVHGWQEKILSALYSKSERSYGKGYFDYDAIVDGVYSFSFLDGNIIRLLKFMKEMYRKDKQFEVLCFDFQEDFLRRFLDERVMIYPVAMEDVEQALNMEE